jgi:hypothetical protein
MLEGIEPVNTNNNEHSLFRKRQNACQDTKLEPCQVTLVRKRKKKKKKKKKKKSSHFFRATQDQCCATGHTCCSTLGRGSGCAPPGGKCCENTKTMTTGFACADGHTCCGNKCMPVGAVCCDTVPGSEDSRYCPPGAKCSSESPTCSPASLLSISSALVALLAVVSFY